MAALEADYQGFETDFTAYYPDLKRHTASWLADERPPHTG